MSREESFRKYKRNNTLKNVFTTAVGIGISAGFAGFSVLQTIPLEQLQLDKIAVSGTLMSLMMLPCYFQFRHDRGNLLFDDDVSLEDIDRFTRIAKKMGVKQEIKVQNISDESLPFIALVDSRGTIFLNRAFYDSVSSELKDFVVAHEFSHVINEEHFASGVARRNAQIFTVAVFGSLFLEQGLELFPLGLACRGVQALLNNKLSRQFEERADVESLFYNEICSKEYNQMWEKYDKKFPDLEIPKSQRWLGLFDSEPTEEHVLKTVTRVLG